MDYKLVLKKIIKAFKEQNVRYALIGGFALGLWGVVRGTMDLDFLVARDDMGKVDAITGGLGYKSFYRTENVTQYVSDNNALGELDFLHAFRAHSVSMLTRAEEKEIFGGEMFVRVLLPDDIIGLKVQAAANDPARRAVDMADIESLIRLHKKRIDWALIEEYFSIFGLIDTLHEIRKRNEDQ